MSFSSQQLIQIVEQSSSFSERMNDNFSVVTNPLKESRSKRRLHQWSEAVAYGDMSLLEKRFSWDGMKIDEVYCTLNDPIWKSVSPLPDWTSVLNEGVTKAADLHIQDITVAEYAFLFNKPGLPFQELFVPFVLVADQILQAQVASNYHLLSPSAHISIQRSLLKRLSKICEQTLYLEFSIMRSKKLSRLSMALKDADDDANSLYLSFIQALYDGGLVSFFLEYAVLARLVGRLIEFWITVNVELIRRLAVDLPSIITEFGLSTGTVTVASIKTDLSDPHNGGRSVSILTFSNINLQLVYKPKSVGMDAAFSKLLAWLNEKGISLHLKALHIIDRRDYGWVEYVGAEPCGDEVSASRYYRRIGMLLCLLYIFEGTDCHNENIIVAGEHPVLIDMETLLHPRIIPASSDEVTNGAQNLARQQYLDSVLRTALLPAWSFGQAGQSYDMSGLGAITGQAIPYQAINWSNINTDYMKVHRVQFLSEQRPATPSLNDRLTSADDYLEEIVAGFQEMYQTIMAQQESLLHRDSPLNFFRQQTGRFVFRHTLNYFLLSEKLLQPQYTRDGIERSIQLDALHKAAIRANSKPEFWALIQAEVEAIEMLDIPYFSSCSTNCSIATHGSLISDHFFNQSGYELMQTRIATLSSEDMEQQVGFIRATFRLRDIKNKPRPIETKHLSLEDSPLSSNLEFLQAAGNVANDIARQAIVASNGSASWLGFEYVLEAERAVIQPLGYNLHSGSAGIALFLAAWERVSGESNYRDLALGAIQQMRNSLRQDHKMIQMMSQRMSLGAAIGQGAIIYCLTRIHTLLNEPTLLEDAQLVANCITMDRIALDTKFDVMDGAAGAILGLLTLYNCTGNQDLLIKATACGHRLLDGRTVSGTGERVWTTLNQGSLLTGFSHGAAGIAYALLRLYEACGNGLFYEAAVEAIAYENRHFAPEQQNWIDLLRTTEQEMVFGNTWCHGAPGIGLARLGTLHLLDNDQIKQDILAALQVTRKMFTENLDTVCCGNLGRSELFITAANKLNDVTWQEMAVHQASSALFRYQQSGAFCMPYSLGTGYSHEYQLGFFHGLAGVGYQLLRIKHSAVLPSVLLWE